MTGLPPQFRPDNPFAPRTQRFSAGNPFAPADASAVAPSDSDDDRPGVVGGSLRAAAQGATLGFSDELRGLAQGFANALDVGGRKGFRAAGRAFSEGRQAGQEDERQDLAAFAEDHPVLNVAAQVAGGVALPIGAGAALARTGGTVARAVAPTLGRRVASGALAGGGTALAAGVGAGEGDLGERVEGAKGAGVVGTLLGAAIPGAGAGLRAGKRLITGAAGTNVDEQAGLQIVSALERSGKTPAQLLSEVARRADDAPLAPQTLLDVGGTGVQRLVRGTRAANTTGSAQLEDFLVSRAQGRGSRLLGGLGSRLQTGRTDVLQLSDDLVTQQRAAAAPLYEAAFSSPPVQLTPKLNRLLQNKTIQQSLTRGLRILDDETAAAGVAAAEEVVRGGGVTVRSLDIIKKGLDDRIEVALRRTGGTGPNRLRALVQLKAAFLEEVDAQVPVYAQARATFAGDAAARTALAQGREILTEDPRAVQRAVAALGPSERETFRIGAFDAVRKKVDDLVTGPDRVPDATRFFRSRESRARLAALFDDPEDAASFFRQVDVEIQQVATERLVRGGSNTADKLADAADIFGLDAAPAAGVQLARGRPGFAFGELVRPFIGRVTERAAGRSAPVAEGILNLAQTGAGNPDDLAQLLVTLERLRATRLVNPFAPAAAGAGTATGLAGGRP